MSTPNPDNLYAPPAADVSTGESAKVPLSLLRRYLLVLVPGSVVGMFLAMLALELGDDRTGWTFRALALIAAWPLPVILILLPFAREAGGWSRLPLRTRIVVTMSYPFLATVTAVMAALLMMIGFVLFDTVRDF